MLSLPPLSLYIHIPWCEKKCPYCDFNSHVEKNGLPEEEYISCLLQDLERDLTYVQGREIETIFIGGGTPSLFSAKSIVRLLSSLSEKLKFSEDIEITMEANPGSSEQQKFSALQVAGINRLSLGIQSFSHQQLELVGRIHSGAEAVSAVNAAQQAGFERINLDIMFGLPQQSAEMALADLQQAIDLGVEHISWYQLTIEQNTEFFRYPPTLPEEKAIIELHKSGIELLSKAGFQQYEISAFSKEGQEAKHNLNYWQFGDYLGIGAGAHGKITLKKSNEIIRYNKTRIPNDYLSRGLLESKSGFFADKTVLEKGDYLFECLMNGLRLKQGVPVELCLQGAQISQGDLLQQCQPLINDGLLQVDNRIKATGKGWRYLDTVLERLLS